MSETKPKPPKSFWERIFGSMWKKSVSSANDTVETLGDMANKAMATAGDITTGTVNNVEDIAGKAVATVGRAAEFVGAGMMALASSMINTTRFLTSAEYRQQEGYPWLNQVLHENWQKVRQEIDESEEMLMILWKYAHGKEISNKESEAAKEQLFDIIRIVPAFAIFCLPGGALFLPLLARAIPWGILPSSFREKLVEEYGEDALKEELRPGEQVPIDKNAQPPEDLQKKAQEISAALEQQAEEHPQN